MQPPPPAQAQRILVGVGASAGGLEALQLLFSNLRRTGKLSFVVAQHVSATQPSMLRALLERETTLSVVELSSGQAPQPDHVYITPPNAHVEYRGGRLELFTPDQRVGPKPSINRFFRSLAEELGEDSVGIILSGTGADGTQGLLAISQRGGLTIVQDPASAKYDGMPRAAQHGLPVDHVLQVPAIAELLLTYAQDGTLEGPAPTDAASKTFASQVIRVVNERAGFDLGAYKASTLQRRIRRRMDKTRIADPDRYLELLRASPTEPADLAREVLVSVTEFFRDPAAFASLSAAIHRLVEACPVQQTLRVWNPGCATGEEAYSIAMLFEEAFIATGSSRNYQVFATDIDEQALQRGRQGVFPASAAATIPEPLRERYFREVGGSLTATKTLRDRIIFSVHNLVTDPPFSRVDLVSCRNLLIYFTVPLQTQVFRLFHYALNPDGLLFLGQAESVDQHRDVFAEVDRDARLYRTLNVPVRAIRFGPTAGATLTASRAPPSRARNPQTFQQSLQQALLRTLVPACLVINPQDEVVYTVGDIQPYVSIREGLLGTGVGALVLDDLRAELRALVFKARRELAVATGAPRQLGQKAVQMTVRPINPPAKEPSEPLPEQLLAVVFQEVSSEARSGSSTIDDVTDPQRLKGVVTALDQELSATRQNLTTVVQELEHANEELQLLNEELQSSNEELQSTNEELQTANEELQSTNEELLTVNDELQAKSRELERAMADIQNIVDSTSSPMIVVERDLRIRRFVKAVDAVIPLQSIHLGDQVTALPWRADIPGLRALLSEVIATGRSAGLMLQVEGRTFKLQITAYYSASGVIDGAVLWFYDVTELELTTRRLVRSERYLSTIFDNAVDAILIIDARGQIQTVNRAGEQIFGYPAKDLVGRSVETLMDGPDKAEHQAFIERYLATGETRILGRTRQLKARRRDGGVFDIELGVSEIDFEGTRLFCGIARDITSRLAAQDQVSLLQEKATATLACISDGIITLDETGVIDYLNPIAERLTGFKLEEVRGRPLDAAYKVLDETSREPIPDVLALLDRSLRLGETLTESLLLVDRQGNELFIEQSLAPIHQVEDGGSRRGTVIGFRDVTAKRRMLEKVTWQARHDPLTGLVNRVEFDYRLERAVQSAKTFGRSHALLYIDLDQFKVVNDTCGHRAGDDLLRQLAGHICVNLRQRDTMARLGGDEFAAILENCTLVQGEQVATKLRESIQAYRFTYEGRVFRLGASIGVVEITPSCTTSVEALRMADVACYAA